MVFHVLTLFPEMIRDGLNTSVTGRALDKGLISLNAVNIRDFSTDKHLHVDDYPYGGGAGMVMQPDPIYRAYRSIVGEGGKRPRVLYMTPQGSVFDQPMAEELAGEEELIFLCGHYEGVDERILEEIVTDYVSIGDYVLTGGELPAMVLIDTVARFLEGVLAGEESVNDESIYSGLLEYPQYSKPREYDGDEVPEILLSGNHGEIDIWRWEQSLALTKERRPDLFEAYVKSEPELTKRQRAILAKYL